MNSLRYIIVSMRPKQWSKNLLVFAALFFNPGIIDIHTFSMVFAGFAVFSVLSSGVYLLNDMLDKDRDKMHPVKSLRPIPSGNLSISSALISCVIFFAVSLI